MEQITRDWEKYAEAVVRAFCTYIGHPYTPPKKVDTYPEVEGTIPIKANGKLWGNGYAIDNTTYIPLRNLGEFLGAYVWWDGKYARIDTKGKE